MGPLTRGQQPLEKQRVVQQRIESFVGQARFRVVLRAPGTPRHQPDGQLRVFPTEPCPDVRENHEHLL